MEINIQKALQSVLSWYKLWMTTDAVSTFIYCSFRSHYWNVICATHTHAHMHALRCIRMMITPVLCISVAPMISETKRWKGERERILVAVQKVIPINLKRETLLCWKCRLLRPCLKWQLILLRSSEKRKNKSDFSVAHEKELNPRPKPFSTHQTKTVDGDEMFTLWVCRSDVCFYIICEPGFAVTWSFWQTLDVAVGIRLTGQQCVSFPGRQSTLQVTVPGYLRGQSVASWGERTSIFLTLFSIALITVSTTYKINLFYYIVGQSWLKSWPFVF